MAQWMGDSHSSGEVFYALIREEKPVSVEYDGRTYTTPAELNQLWYDSRVHCIVTLPNGCTVEFQHKKFKFKGHPPDCIRRAASSGFDWTVNSIRSTLRDTASALRFRGNATESVSIYNALMTKLRCTYFVYGEIRIKDYHEACTKPYHPRVHIEVYYGDGSVEFDNGRFCINPPLPPAAIDIIEHNSKSVMSRLRAMIRPGG